MVRTNPEGTRRLNKSSVPVIRDKIQRETNTKRDTTPVSLPQFKGRIKIV